MTTLSSLSLYLKVQVLPQHHHQILPGEGDKLLNTVVHTLELMAIYVIL